MKTTDKPHKRINKNAPQIKDLNQMAFRYFDGVGLFAIEGLSHSTILTIISEIGPEGFNRFKTAKQFSSWLRLAPNNRISGGRYSVTECQKEATVQRSPCAKGPMP